MHILNKISTAMAGVLCIALFTSTAQAQDCPAAVGKRDPSMSDEEIRAHDIASMQSALCSFREIRDRTDRVKADADYEVFDWIEKFHLGYLNLIATRLSFPGKQLHDRLENSERYKDHQQDWWQIINYIGLSQGIYIEENCEHEKFNGMCVQDPYLMTATAQGKDWYEELDRTANAKRPNFIDPWFLIGDVIIDDSALSEQSFRLRHNAKEAKKAYELAMETRDMRAEELAEAARQHEANTAEFLEPVNKIKSELAKILDRYQRSDEDIANSQEFRNLTARSETITKRLGEIERAIDYLFSTYPDDDAFANQRMQALDNETVALETEQERIAVAKEGLSIPKLTPSDQTRVDQLKDELDLVESDAERRIARDKENHLSAKRLSLDAEARFLIAGLDYAKADIALRQFMDETRFAVKSIYTNDAEIELVTDSITEALKIINEDLHDHEALLEQAYRVRERAREEMIDAADIADVFAEELLQSGYYSLALQVGVEWADAAYKIAKSAKGGPLGVGVELISQLVTNTVIEPSYYEYQGGRMEDYLKGQSPWMELGIVETFYLGNLLDKGAKRVKKTYVGYIFKVLKQDLTSFHLKKMIREAEVEAINQMQRFKPEGYKNAQNILKDKAALAKGLKESDLTFKSLTGQKGFKSFVSTVGLDMLKGFGTSLIKEELKKMSNLIAQPAFDEYMAAQLALHETVMLFRKAGNEYWNIKKLVEFKREMRDTLIEEYRPDENQYEGKNDPFFADPGYQIALEVEEEFEGQFKADVTLQGIPLERDPRRTTPVWRLPENSLDLFKAEMPERLELRVILK
ncbi:hypothetical protein ROA7450_02796 [Roseovarius albus]|uniref:Chromosome partition protein Smc n=1 Tax=Roseovarius albus TaxID=1247867 RepID=A0A1X6ZKL8_9RHOB|nr:hypothetical protein [Roseovarius albus]SLN54288.1 hypothetical protein ROA7450_02796 [Roseovarius albus]